jgi:hypothetical protein
VVGLLWTSNGVKILEENTEAKGKAVPLHATKALGGEEV